jgi:hypothetical protein
MESNAALATIRDQLAKVEPAAELLADAGLRVSLSGDRLDVGGLAEALGDLDAATARLRQLLARLPAEVDLGAVAVGERPS